MIKTAVIRAAGISARLYSALANKPKGFLAHLHKYGIENTIIGTGFRVINSS